MARKYKSGEPIEIGQPTIVSLLMKVIVYMAIIFLIFSLFFHWNRVTESNASYSPLYSRYFLSKDLAKSKSVTYYLKDNWVFVPNVTPIMVKVGAVTTDNYYNMPFASNVSIDDTIYGWNSLGGEVMWHNCDKMPELETYNIDNMSKNSVAYITEIALPPEVSSVSLDIPDINGIARIFCNGKYVGDIGGRDLNKPLSFNDSTADILTLTSDNGTLKIIIVVSCNDTVVNPGIVSYPLIENQVSSIRAIVISYAWLSLLIVLSILAIGGCLIVQRTFSSRWKSLFFILLTVFFLLFYLVDCRFISSNAIIRSNLRFTLTVMCELWVYYFISSLFTESKKLMASKLLLYDGILPAAIGLAGIASINLYPEVLGTLFPRYFILLYISLFSVVSIFKILFIFLQEKNSGIAICFTFTSILCLIQMIDHEIMRVNIPSYSLVFVISIFALELMFILQYVRNSREVANMSMYLETQVKEKTLHINEINRDLIEKNKQLIAGEEARKTVLSNVSHDLRTPITAIRGYAELLISNGDKITDDQKKNYLTNIIKRSNQMERIVSDIVEITRMESNINEFQFTDISLTELIDEIVMMYQGDLKGTKKNLDLDISYDDMMIVKADPKKISRVFENLISNSINYTHEEAHILVKAWRTNQDMPMKDQRIHVTIKDDGIGIPEGEIDHIFDRFYRAKNSGQNIKGTGLGLSIVKLICDKHDAEISVESKTGLGTTFHITFKATN